MDRYSDASGAIFTRVHVLGNEIVRGFQRFLEDGACVLGVPPDDDWNPDRGDYRDAKFSDFGSLVLIESIRMGIAIRIPHTRDDGAFWLRIVLTLEPKDGGVSVWIGDEREVRDLGASNSPTLLEPVYQHILDCAKEWFDEPLRTAGLTGRRSIGFISAKEFAASSSP